MGRILRRLVVLSVLGLVAYGAYVQFGGGRPIVQQGNIVYVDPMFDARPQTSRAP